MRKTYLIPLILSSLSLFAIGCGTPATKIGSACKTVKDCNIAGQICVGGLQGGPSICTKTCTGNLGDTGCPPGFDCGPVDASTTTLTCNQVRYSVDPLTGDPLLFGKSCALDATVCTGTGDPNAGAACRKGPNTTKNPPIPLADDPTAFCTGTCDTNDDCPTSMRCATDYDMVKKCLRRNICDECTISDNCPTDYPVCVVGKDSKKYCSKVCGGDEDCPGAPQNVHWMTCEVASDAGGTQGRYCAHRFGGCVGDGTVCAPCRTNADCSGGTKCISNDNSLERFCTKGCANDTTCASANATGCDNKMHVGTNDPYPTNVCTGDNTPTKTYWGVLSCWPAPLP